MFYGATNISGLATAVAAAVGVFMVLLSVVSLQACRRGSSRCLMVLNKSGLATSSSSFMVLTSVVWLHSSSSSRCFLVLNISGLATSNRGSSRCLMALNNSDLATAVAAAVDVWECTVAEAGRESSVRLALCFFQRIR